ncbi:MULTISPECIES: DUF3883 domain-containing protein [unclassified Brucella]|uniref:DUF3883 domain-containing protein n=2 Tax=Brucella TaxID=234 RepID=UPI00176A3BEC|nr:DUF3883 domain-containing protein [Brucella sp. 191011898]CAB4327303.1 hypothetical protein BCH_02700 [Brucella sp. 191011898]
MDFDRLFTISAFEGLRQTRLVVATVPEVTIDACPDALIAYSPQARNYDLEAAMELHELVAAEAAYDNVFFYRECILAVLLLKMPAFAKLMTLGRGRFIKRIKGDDYRDIRSVFREAKLLEDSPSNDDIFWWDNVQGRVRFNFDQERLRRARYAESLSLASEKAELAKLGITKAPVWMAIDDNTVGYDVLSYRPTPTGESNLLIEVKSTIASPLRFIVTRNEWENADQIGQAYIFHMWDMDKSPPILHVRTVEQIRVHIPADNAKGRWKTAEIPVGA